jgi:hypothetical protein
LRRPFDTTAFNQQIDSARLFISLLDAHGTLLPFATVDTTGQARPAWIGPFSSEVDTTPAPKGPLPRRWWFYRDSSLNRLESLSLITTALFKLHCERNWAFYTTQTDTVLLSEQVSEPFTATFSLRIKPLPRGERDSVSRLLRPFLDGMHLRSNSLDGEGYRRVTIQSIFYYAHMFLCLLEDHGYEGSTSVLIVFDTRNVRSFVTMSRGGC